MHRALASLLLSAACATAAEERLGPDKHRYDLTVAPGATPSEPKDLVIGLHGKGGKKESMAQAVGRAAPAGLKDCHQVWVQANTEHWRRDAIPHLAELARRLRR